MPPFPISYAYEPNTNTCFRIQLVQSWLHCGTCIGYKTCLTFLLVNRNFIKSFIKLFETSIEYICCEIISVDDIASGEAVRYKRLV